MTTATEFNLRTVLHDAVEATADPDPGAVAEAAFDSIAPADQTEALRQALRMLTPHYVAETRPTRRGAKKSRKKRKLTGSRLVARTHKLLASKEFSPFRNRWITLGEATVEDLESIAEARYSLAEQTRHKGDWYSAAPRPWPSTVSRPSASCRTK